MPEPPLPASEYRIIRRSPVSQQLIDALQNPALYNHSTGTFKLYQTHISWVLLTGDYAYKIKKPMDFGFLNFSTLEKRQFFCEQEVKLNKRLAPEIYLDVLPISGSEDAPRLGDDSAPFEYAIRMKQFDGERLLSNLQAEGLITSAQIDSLAHQIAGFHSRIQQADDSMVLGSPAEVLAPAQQNFDQIREMLDDKAQLAQLSQLEGWMQDTFSRLEPLFARRKATGMIRECHGDIHLGNVALIQEEGADKVTLFDCIEFNDEFRWIDVICDAGFLVMDLEARGEYPLARQFINQYLELTGDYEGIQLLPFYKAYRAMVRAKVTRFMLADPSLDEAGRAALEADFQRYIDLAESYTVFEQPFMLITHGVSGSGKSSVSQGVIKELGVVRIRSDVERKRLFGLDADADSRSELDAGIYTPQATQQTYEKLAELADCVIHSVTPVIIDATNLKRWQRDALRDKAEQLGVPALTLSFTASRETLERRISKRLTAGDDASEADLSVLHKQLADQDPIAEDEADYTVTINTDEENASQTLLTSIRRQFGLSH